MNMTEAQFLSRQVKEDDALRALEYEEAPNPDCSGYVGSPKPESSMVEVLHQLQALENAVRELSDLVREKVML